MEFGHERGQPFETLPQTLNHLAEFGDFGAGFALLTRHGVKPGSQFLGLFGEFAEKLFELKETNVKNSQQLFDSLVGGVAHGGLGQFREIADETTSNAQWKALDNDANR